MTNASLYICNNTSLITCKACPAHRFCPSGPSLMWVGARASLCVHVLIISLLTPQHPPMPLCARLLPPPLTFPTPRLTPCAPVGPCHAQTAPKKYSQVRNVISGTDGRRLKLEFDDKSARGAVRGGERGRARLSRGASASHIERSACIGDRLVATFVSGTWTTRSCRSFAKRSCGKLRHNTGPKHTRDSTFTCTRTITARSENTGNMRRELRRGAP